MKIKCIDGEVRSFRISKSNKITGIPIDDNQRNAD